MTRERNPFEVLKNIPYLDEDDEDFLQDITGMDWPDPAGVLSRLGQGKWPPVDMVETAGEIIITAAIPGLHQATDVRVGLTGNILQLEGETSSELQALPAVKVHQQERRYGKFRRTVTLPVAVHSESPRASYQRGILEVRLAKFRDSQVQVLTIDFGK